MAEDYFATDADNHPPPGPPTPDAGHNRRDRAPFFACQLEVGKLYSSVSEVATLSGCEPWHVRNGDGVSAKKKLLRCRSGSCRFEIVLKRKRLADSPNESYDEEHFLWRVEPSSVLEHTPETCMVGADISVKDAAKIEAVKDAFTAGPGKITQAKIQRVIKEASGKDVDATFVSRVKAEVEKGLQKDFMQQSQQTLPYLEALAELNPQLYAVARVVDKLGVKHHLCFGRAKASAPIHGDIIRHMSALDTYGEVIAGGRVEYVVIGWEWANQVVDCMPPVFSLDAAFAKGVNKTGCAISQLAGRLAGIYVPLITMYHAVEDYHSHQFALAHALAAVPFLASNPWLLISDRGKGIKAAFKKVVRAVNETAHAVHDKPHLWRNILHRFPELLLLDQALRPGEARLSLQLVQQVLYATTPLKYSEALQKLDGEYAKVRAKGKKTTGQVRKEANRAEGRSSKLSTVTLLSRAMSAAAEPVVAGADLADEDDEYEDDEARAAALDANHASGQWRIPHLAPRNVDGVDEPAEGVYEKPSQYIELLDKACFLCYEMPLRDFLISSSNAAEAEGSTMLRNQARSVNVAISIQIIHEGIKARLAECFARLSAQKANPAAARVVSAWPFASRNDHSAENARTYSCKTVAASETYKVYVQGQAMSSHYVGVPSRKVLNDAKAVGLLAAAPAVPSSSWLRPPTGMWQCDGGCLVPQRGGFLCKHAKRALLEAFPAPEDQRLATAVGYATYYQLEHLHHCLSQVSVNLVQVKDVALGPAVDPIVMPARFVLEFEPSNGGRPAGPAADSRKRSHGEFGKTVKKCRAAAASGNADGPKVRSTVKCKLCGEPGHNKATCARRAQLAQAATAAAASSSSAAAAQPDDASE